jgi:integrase
MAKAKYTYSEKRKEWVAFVWDGTYDSNGKKRRKQITSKKSSKDLEEKVYEFRRNIKERGALVRTNMTFGEYANHWLSTAKKGTKEKHTVVMYRNVIDIHLRSIANVSLDQIRHSHFQSVIAAASDKPRTCEQIYVTFRQIIRMAVQDHILPKADFDLICNNISLPKYSPREKRPLTPLEKEAIKKCDFTTRERCLVSILSSCGLRREEVLALTPKDFDFERKEITIDKTVIFLKNEPELKNCPKTERGYRKVPFPQMDYFKDFILGSRHYVFGNDSGELITKSGYLYMFDRILLKINAAAGGKNAYNPVTKKTEAVINMIPGLTAHVFRHNFCTELCYQIPKISIKKIAALMGDTEKVVLDVYNHIMEEKEDATEVINQIRLI